MSPRPGALVLGFDTSGPACAAALLRGEDLLALADEEMATGQAERLMPMLENLLERQGLGWRDLAGIGVGTGPGNFTGVRIAVAAARGLALGLGIPAVGVTRFQALAIGHAGPLTVVEDARRGEVYAVRLPDGVPALMAAELAATLGGPFTGSAAALMPGPVLAARYPPAEAVARIAAGLTGRQPRPAPFYLRGADAAPPSDPPPVILP